MHLMEVYDKKKKKKGINPDEAQLLRLLLTLLFIYHSDN